MNRIKEVLKEKKITQKELAVRLNVSDPVISYAINGNPTVEMLERIAAALNVPISELFERKTENEFYCPKCGAKLEVVNKE